MPRVGSPYTTAPPQATRLRDSNRITTNDRPSPCVREMLSGHSQRREVAKDIAAESTSAALATTSSISPPNLNLTKIRALIDLQSFSGAWKTDIEQLLLDILGFEIPKPPPSGYTLSWVNTDMYIVRLLYTCFDFSNRYNR